MSDHVWIDNVAAARDLTSHLLQTGRRRIAALGVMGSETSRLRLVGYRQALQAAGRPVDPDLEIPCHRWTSAGGAAALTAHLADHPRPDAVFCFTDSLALGVLHALWTLGHAVPEDVSVVGYDDVIDGEYAVPPLTTLHFDKAALQRGRPRPAHRPDRRPGPAGRAADRAAPGDRAGQQSPLTDQGAGVACAGPDH